MGTYFKEGMTSFTHYSFVALALAIFLSGQGWGAVKQPIQYNHNKHIKLGLVCSFCHQYYEQMPAAGLPGVKVCMNCHVAPVTANPEAEKIKEYAKNGQEIRWGRVYLLPRDIYFSHRRHVVLGKISCEKCHGDVKSQSKPFTRQLVKQTMDGCVACHRQSKVSVDCVACHH